MLWKTRAPDALSFSKKKKKKLKTVEPPTPFPGFPKCPMLPSSTLAPAQSHHPHCAYPTSAPAFAPQTLRAHIPTWRLPAGAPPLSPGGPSDLRSPLPTSTSRRTRPTDLPGVGLGSTQGGVSGGPEGSEGGAGAALGPRPADPAVGAARSQAGGGLSWGRGAGRGGAARDAHGGIARHRAGQLCSVCLRCRLRSHRDSQQPLGAKPEPGLAGGEEGGGVCWGRGRRRVGPRGGRGQAGRS